MARSIVLRFDAVCSDCGASLSAGTTARWFGKGRVSCCGNPTTKPGDYSPAAVPSNPPRTVPMTLYRAPDDTLTTKPARAPHSPKLASIVQGYARRVFSPAALVEKHRDAGTLAELPEVRAEQHVWDLLHKGPGASSAGLSPFGLYMAATHYSDHVNGHNPSTRLASTWFGAGANTRERAETEAMALAGTGS